jgi:hypothetical protein
MPSVHAPDKTCVATWIPRTLERKLKKRANERKFEFFSGYIEHLFTTATNDVELTPEDYHQIARETEQARKKIDRRMAAARAETKAKKEGK